MTRRNTKSGLPPLRHYLSEAYRYRTFALYWSKADVKARNFETILGKAWLVLNPFLYGLIYFIFVAILSSGGSGGAEQLAFIVGNIYVWGFFSSTIVTSVTSVQSGAGGVLAQSSVPRVVLPAASMITATTLFLRSLLAYIPLHLFASRGLHIEMLWLPVLVLLTGLLATGIGLFLAVVNVYIRDVSRLLPHFLRLWLYLSPAIWLFTRVSGDTGVEKLARLNPMYSGMTAWTIMFGGPVEGSDTQIVTQLLIFSAWTVGVLAAGFLFFVAREDDFAVRN